MTYIPDLHVCNYFGLPHGGNLLAVGWLDTQHEYTKGNSCQDDYEKLQKLFLNPFQPLSAIGPHECDLCQFGGAMGSTNLFLPHNGNILVAPELILHYINAHHYHPPEPFWEAVRAIDDTRDMKYKKALLANNGSFLVRR